MLAILARLFSSLKLNINYDTFPHGTVHVSSDIKHINNNIAIITVTSL